MGSMMRLIQCPGVGMSGFWYWFSGAKVLVDVETSRSRDPDYGNCRTPGGCGKGVDRRFLKARIYSKPSSLNLSGRSSPCRWRNLRRCCLSGEAIPLNLSKKTCRNDARSWKPRWTTTAETPWRKHTSHPLCWSPRTSPLEIL